MVASGVTRTRLPGGQRRRLHPARPARSRRWRSELGTTRSAAALELWRDRLDGAVVAIGNAPTALFHLLEMIDAGAPRPGRRARHPGRLHRRRRVQGGAGRAPTGWSYLVVRGRRGGSAITAAAAVNAHRDARRRSCEHGHRLYGVGLGPGDPELVTVKAARLIGAADVIAYHSARHGRSHRPLGSPRRYLRDGQIEEPLVYPVTTETTDHPGGYQGAIDEFYAAAAARLAAHLDAGRDVVVLAEGDPFFYGSYMHMHKRLAHRYPTEVVPGVTSVSAAAAALGRPLVERDEVLTVLPGTLPRRRAGRAAGRHRLGGGDEARPHLPRRPRGRSSARARSRGLLRRARHDGRAAHRCRWPTSTPTRCRTSPSPCCRAR